LIGPQGPAPTFSAATHYLHRDLTFPFLLSSVILTHRCDVSFVGGSEARAHYQQCGNDDDRRDRFRRSRDVGAHLGLTPGATNSGETDVRGRGPHQLVRDELARAALYEAAHSLLIRSTKWSALRAWGMNAATYFCHSAI